MQLLWAGPDDGATLVLAHSAGAPMDSPWMTAMCTLLAGHGIRTARFEFAYMAARREGRRPPPPKAELSQGEYADAVAEVRRSASGRVLVGGKSYGGRVASLIADDVQADGLVCLGYPFHPPQRPEQVRTAHLLTLRTPALICQGERDPFGGPAEVAGYHLPESIQVEWFPGDHDVQRVPQLGRVADRVAAFVLSTPRR
ncbi:MAG: alpha/beta hydrolase family protein [Pseudolysinimonas sp.]